MLGFLAGILFVNEKPSLFNKIYSEIYRKNNSNLTKNFKITYPETFSFSGNFDVGGGKQQAENIIGNKVVPELVFPAAGPQTADLLSVIQKYKTKTKILGIDVDQTKKFYNQRNIFLTNAVKRITEAIEVSILCGFIEKGNEEGESKCSF
jgi:basic membrane lipoprotein Med (substrate-binding protein (PBP1-ABC) superfamily)